MRNAPRVETSTERRRCGLLALVLCFLAAHVLAQPLTPIRLQIALSSEEPTTWRGELSLSEGRLERLQPLNLDPIAAAALRVDEGRLLIDHQRPLRRDVFNVTVSRPPGGELIITPRDAQGRRLEPVPVSLDAALSAPQSVTIGPGEVQLTVTRVANDRLRIETDRESLVFAPGEEFAFDLIADPLGVERGRPYDVTATLQRGRSGEEVWRGETTRVEAPAVGAARVPIALPLPAGEGVYTVRLSATRPPGFLSRFPTNNSPPVLSERTFQVAVFDPQRRPAVPTDWEETHAFEPGATSWVRRVPDWMRWRRLPWPHTGPLSSEEGAPAESLSPRDASGACHWRAYPLPIEQAGALYAVEVQYEGETDEALTVALVEPNALGELRPIGKAVTRPARRWNRDAGALTLRLTARPRTTSPMLVLANPSERRAVRFGRIRLLRAQETDAAPSPTERLVALDWSDADLPRALGASHALSPVGRFEQPDLQTDYETAVALAERVQIAGANGAVVAINQQGGAIYLSEVWTTPRFDLGCWSDGAGDLPRRELLGLIGREFRRRGLRLVLGVRFDEATSALVGPDSVLASARVLGVQQAVLSEAINAIGDAEVLGGVAVRVDQGGWALLGQGAEASARSALASRYNQLAYHLNRRVPQARLLMTTDGLIPNTPLTPRLGGATSEGQAYLQQLGLTALVESSQSLQVVSPLGGRSGFSTSPRSATSAEYQVLRESLGLTPNTGTLAFRSERHTLRLHGSGNRPRALRDLKSPAGLEIEAWIADPVTEGELLANAARADAPVVLLDGPATAGWVASRESTRRAMLARTPLPPSVREPSEVDGGDVTAIAFDTNERESIALATNRSPWPRKARLTLETRARVRGVGFDQDASQAEWFEPGQHALELELPPHQTIGWRFAGGGVQVVGLRTEPNPAAEAELTAAVADLQSRDTTARRAYDATLNPSFETAAEGNALVGWSAGAGVKRDERQAFEGAASAGLKSSIGTPAVLTSEPFAMPTTGQLVVSFRLRPGALSPEAELRIELEQADGDYRNGTRLLASQLVPEGSPSGEWLPPIVFPIDDLPLEEDASLRLRFTLSGEGELHLDDLQAEDLLLPLDGYGSIALRSEKFALVRLLSETEDLLAEGRFGACRERLDSYWARFLVDHFPVHEPEPAIVTEPEEPTGEVVENLPEEAAPSLSKRLKGYLPRWWR